MARNKLRTTLRVITAMMAGGMMLASSCSLDQVAAVARGLADIVDPQDDEVTFGDLIDSATGEEDDVDFGDWVSDQMEDW